VLSVELEFPVIMKTCFLQGVAAFGLASLLQAADFTAVPLGTNETSQIKQKLEMYEKGKITLDELTPEKAESGENLIAYYLSHTNEVTVKMKLPISRCFAGSGMFPEAARLSGEYVRVYSNDWRGWKILGGANGVYGQL
jgi:hypothetical protein